MLRIGCTMVLGVIAGVSSVAAGATDGGDAMIDYGRLANLGAGERVEVEGVVLEAGVTVDLALERFEILAPDARLIVSGAHGARAMATPSIVLLRGTVAGEPEHAVFLGVSPFGVQGFVEREGELLFLSTGPYRGKLGDDFELAVTNAADLPARPEGLACGTGRDRADLMPLGPPAPVAGGVTTGTVPCRAARVALDTDWEFTGNLFAGDTEASAAYALFLTAAISEIYRRDLNVRLFVPYLRVWESNVDPYDASTTGEALDQLRDHWRANHGDVDREVAHLLSGASLGGGVAYLSVVCSFQWGYGVSANLGGSFPYPLRDNDNANWDPYVLAHELGHNFGTLHTHDGYDPPLDGCGLGDCEGAEDGTIMSYCHGCPGGISNINLHFHPVVIETILAYLDGVPCDVSHSGPFAADDAAATYEGAAVVVDVLPNDVHASCDGDVVELDDFDGTSDGGGSIVLVPAGGGEPLDRLEYTPAGGYIGADAFTYRLLGGAEARVDVAVDPLRDPDTTGATEPGVAVRYYELDGPQQLPDFDTLTPYAEDVVPDVAFPLTGGNFATSGRRSNVGAVFEGFVTVPADGPYTLFTESDAGSALYVGDERVVANDGVHPMRERAGDVLLEAGPHAVRIEFFNDAGGSGLIARIEGPGLPKQVIPPSAWSHAVPCPEDLDQSGVVDFGDILAVLAAWGPCPPESCPEDLDGSGAVDFADLLVVLSVWGPCVE